MNGLIVEFTDKVTEEGDQHEREDWLCFPRKRYLGMLEAARKGRIEWLLREGAEFICEACKSYIVPAQALYRVLGKMYPDPDDDTDNFICSLSNQLTRPYPMTDDDWKSYFEGKLRHVPFLYDDKGELNLWDERGPMIMAYDEVVFKFRQTCICDSIYRRMYENNGR